MHLTSPTQRRSGRTLAAVAATAGLAIALAGCAADTAGPSDDTVYTLSVASFLLDDTPNADMVNWWLDMVEEESDGRIVFDRFPAESLCPGAEIVQCVADGRADLGITVPSYTPDKFPLQALSALPFMTDDNQAMMAAFHTLGEENEVFDSESTSLGLRNIAYWPAGASLIGSKVELDSVDDLSGLRIRAVGDGLLSAMNAAGAAPVALTAGEMYEGVERGVIDAVANNMDAPIAYKLTEVLPNWVDTGYGHYITIGLWISEAAYDALPGDLQAVIDAAEEKLNDGSGIAVFAETAATQCDFMLEQDGITVTRWSDAKIAEFKKLTGDSAAKAWVAKANEAGIDDAEVILDRYEELLAEYGDDDARVAPLADCAARFEDR